MRPGKVALILEAARLGATYERAARCGGISRKTLWEWLKKGREELDSQDDAEEALEAGESGVVIPALGPHGEFALAWGQAETEAQLEAIRRVREAAKDPRNWRAAARFMAWRWPETWGTPAQQKRIKEYWEKRDLTLPAPSGPRPQVLFKHIGLEEIDPDDPLLEQIFCGPDY